MPKKKESLKEEEGHPRSSLLVVDDDPDILRIVKFFLSKQQYEVFDAADGAEALEVLESHPEIELILSDVMMPRVNGLDLLKAVRANAKFAEIPVILISAEGETSQKVAGLNLGADDFITKPFNFDELMARVRNHLRLRLLQKDLLAANDQLKRQNDILIDDLETAKGVQMAMLPDTYPESLKFRLGARYQPVDRLGGDLFDMVELDDGNKFGVLIVDVCGHGVPAALITAMTKVTFRNACFLSNDPAEVLSLMNGELSTNMTSGFITAFYAIYDLQTGSLSYSSGGHPPLLVHRRGQNKIFELEPQSTFLGTFSHVEFTTDTIPLQKDDRIIFYTDGLFESQNGEQDQYGMERVTENLVNNSGLDIQPLVDFLLDDLHKFLGGATLDDDITIVGWDFLS
ncbi:MAG: fused response regulator/phosphatase [bacterium]